MQMMRIPGVGYLVILLGVVWLIQQVVTAFAPILTLVWIVATAGVVIGVLHSYGLTSPLSRIPFIGDNLMNLMDKYTNKQVLMGMVDGTVPLPSSAQKVEKLDIDQLRENLKQNVFGQNRTIDELTAILRRRLHMDTREKPVGVFLLAGPAGVGKTELGKQLGTLMERPFLFFDMSQCQDSSGATTLFGSPKGYQGSDSYGLLTGGLRSKPSAVVLLDEIEKASPEVTTRFLTAWNDGFVTEASTGEKVPTSRAIFVATTNAAQKEIGEIAASIEDRDERIKATKAVLVDAGFKREVLSRVDAVFSFNPLSEEGSVHRTDPDIR